MGTLDLGIDFGSTFTTVYAKGQGIVLREPTVLVTEADGTPFAAGEEAKKLIGRTPKERKVVFPVFEGVIANRDGAESYLDYVFSKVVPGKILKPKVRVVATVPCGATAKDRGTLEEVLSAVGVRETVLVEGCRCQMLGLDFSYRQSQPVVLVDIGGGKTDVSVVADGSIVAGCTLGVGGNNVDTGIIDRLMAESGLRVGLLSAEKLKSTVLSLSERENPTGMISGQDVQSGTPRSMLASSRMLYPVVAHYYDKIGEVLDVTVKSLPADLSGALIARGVYLVGGGSKMSGLVGYFERTLGYSYRTVANADFVTALGAGRICEDPKLMPAIVNGL